MLKKIPVARLTLGMYLHDFGESWIDHPFWRARFRLTDPDDLRKIHARRIETVIIDTEKGRAGVAPARSPRRGPRGPRAAGRRRRRAVGARRRPRQAIRRRRRREPRPCRRATRSARNSGGRAG
ncbi:MAG: DUF3391 domain-containing protein [Burkholderiaceae bacterium]